MKRIIACLVIVVFFSSCDVSFTGSVVNKTTGTLPQIPTVNVADSDRFLNDLKLSPFWKVEKNDKGSFVAKARSIAEDWPADEIGSFLFEFMADPNRQLPPDYRIRK